MKRLIIILGALLVLVAPIPALAFVPRAGQTVVFSESLEDDLYIAGGTVDVTGRGGGRRNRDTQWPGERRDSRRGRHREDHGCHRTQPARRRGRPDHRRTDRGRRRAGGWIGEDRPGRAGRP